MVHAKRERATKKETPDVTNYYAEKESEPIHSGTAPAEDEGMQQIIMKISQRRICLQEEIAIEHTEGKNDCESTAEAVRPLKWWIGTKAEDGHR